MISPQDHPVGFLAVLAGIGAFIGLGKLLGSNEPLTWRLAAGRCMASSGLGAAAGATTIVFPNADPIVLLGIAAALASAGSSVLEMALKRRVGGDE